MDQIKHSARACLAIVLIALLAAAAFADTLRLKDGSIIKGRIVSFGAGKFVVLVGEGNRERQMTFAANEVESIQFDSAAERTEPAADAQYVETSTPSASKPRVVKTDPIPPAQEPKPKAPATLPQAAGPSRAGIGRPVELSVKVLADNSANGWTNSGWVVRKGQKIRVIGGGSISLGKGRSTGPSGLYDLDDPAKLLKSVPTGALIAVIGDDNNEFIYIGSERTFTASRDGALFLGVNEGDLSDNSGSYDVRIEIEPA